MGNIQTINPEKFIANSKGRFYEIFLITDRELMSWTKRGFHNAEMNASPTFGKNIEVFRREEVVEEYYNAINNAKGLSRDGNLQIIELPLMHG